MKEIVAGPKNLHEVTECIRQSGKRVVLLEGTLGSGKTTLVQAFAKELGQEGVSSPTFSVQQIYGERIYHYDLYQAGFAKFMELGLFEELEKEGYHFIEWPSEELENFLRNIGIPFLKIQIEPRGEKRIYRCIDS
jgi:tRNA threonylcarbamoyladenosine biosynthesis protein TsaE